MRIDYSKNEVRVKEKIVTKLDRFVLDFVGMIQPFSRYVVVSGYVAILFGRARGTEDIDIIIDRMTRDRFQSFYVDVLSSGLYFLNPEEEEGLHEMLEEGLGIRAALNGTIIPNIEMKFAKDDFDRYSLENRVRVLFSKEMLYISPIEMQIPYKLWLGSEKDIEDAIFLWEVFKESIDPDTLRRLMKELEVRGEEYGIEI